MLSLFVGLFNNLLNNFVTPNVTDLGLEWKNVSSMVTVRVTPYLDMDMDSRARLLAKNEFSAFEPVESYSGYFTVNKTKDSNLFFWFFPAASYKSKDEPVVLWLQGQTDRSCLYGVFEESGPFIISKEGAVSRREYSWNNHHNMLYIDYLPGVGLSYFKSGKIKNMDDVTNQLYEALRQFYKMFPDLKSNELYIAGRYFSGRVAPELAFLIDRNKNQYNINLKGLILGNPWFDPPNMIKWSKNLYNIGFIDDPIKEQFEEYEANIIQLIKNRNFETAWQNISDLLTGPQSFKEQVLGKIDIHNFLEEKDISKKPPNFVHLLKSLDLRKGLHVGAIQYNKQISEVVTGLRDELFKSSANKIEHLLIKYRILFYSSQLDLLVPYLSVVEAIKKLNFEDKIEFIESDTRCPWIVDEMVRGFVKEAGMLTDIMVRGVTHRVEQDDSHAGYDMIYKFSRNIKFCEDDDDDVNDDDISVDDKDVNNDDEKD